ncbi:DNA recombination protein RmuC [Hujiaoplasma nucleasis]|uniref:DNA recombination protein RmuC n=1 Tax=Hujiaoplasma nucleasis TaxID=2725268 RepID=A0A7L6N443_9MOLU|nr:DNA recombination protein RmuC [Hujiaoplasma nucleasis]QLY40321.1 DNA recombination protein RmuC [Hujiaoplasma nucleasis]
MDRLEILMLICIGLILVLIVLELYFIVRKHKEKDMLDDSFVKEVRLLENNLKTEMTQSILSFNNEVNKQLLNVSDLSSKNITDFRIRVNQQLNDFQEKISDKFNLEFKTLTESFHHQMQNVNQKVEERLNQGFKDTNETFINIVKRVEVIDEAQKNIKALSEEMVSLQNILSNNQSRGAYGEYQLNQLLYSIYGDNNKMYQTQYAINDDQKSLRVDAVIFMPKPNSIIPIDSKFPFSAYSKLFDNEGLTKEEENSIISQFAREVKKHITDIANKYILPPKTTDYALMFVPSDGILSLLHSKSPQVIDYAREKSVTIVSPTTIIPLLSSFKAFVIDHQRSENMEKINQELLKLGKDFKIFGQEWSKLSRTIQTIKKDSDLLDSRVERISSKFDSIQDVSMIDEGSKQEDGPN